MAQQDLIMPVEAMGELPIIRSIDARDLADALRRGLDDFKAMPTHAVFLVALYPVIGLLLGALSFGYELLPILYPLASGFAIVGPFAAIGLYELSRRREAGLDTSWKHAFDIVHSPSFPAILGLGLLLVAIFAVWLAVAQALYIATFGDNGPKSVSDFARALSTTSEGRMMVVVGNAIGLVFAVVAFALSVVSFPLLLDRHVGFGTAVGTSLKVIAKNPSAMALWAVIVAAGIALGSLPFLTGLAIAMPIFGHATWHLYRKVIEADGRTRPVFYPRDSVGVRYAADFPASLFAPYKGGSGPVPDTSNVAERKS